MFCHNSGQVWGSKGSLSSSMTPERKREKTGSMVCVQTVFTEDTSAKQTLHSQLMSPGEEGKME